MLVIVKRLHEELLAVGEQLRFIADFCGKELITTQYREGVEDIASETLLLKSMYRQANSVNNSSKKCVYNKA